MVVVQVRNDENLNKDGGNKALIQVEMEMDIGGLQSMGSQSQTGLSVHTLLCNKLSQTYYSSTQHIPIVSQFLCVRSPDLDELGPLLQECSHGMWTRASVSSGSLLGEGSTSKLL